VGGIAAGNDFAYELGGEPFSGVAPDANLISVRITSLFSGAECAGHLEDPCTRIVISDVIKGLEWLYEQRANFPLAAANLSLGHDIFTSDCDSTTASFWKPPIDNLRSAGIATVVASGNSGNNTGIAAPACISTAIAVGATDDSDAVASFSNSSPSVDLLAPGVNIQAPFPGATFQTWPGTSYAAPHVAGAFAIQKQIDAAASVTTHAFNLIVTGKPVTDPDNSVTWFRIRTLAAGTRLRDTGLEPAFVHKGRGADIASNGVGLTTRAGGPSSGAITISGIPAGATIDAALLYWMTIGGPDDTATFQGVSRTGELVGASRGGCWNVNQNGPYRTYRAFLPVEDAPGNGSYTVSGVGSSPLSEGQGASLVIFYSKGDQRIGSVYLNDGAMSLAASSERMTHRFSGLTYPPVVRRASLHLGMADGYAANLENPMQFMHTDVTPANFFGGSDGAAWDDLTLALDPRLLARLPTRTNSISLPASGGNCLSWPYAALAYG
jgi:hypothetical protein